MIQLLNEAQNIFWQILQLALTALFTVASAYIAFKAETIVDNIKSRLRMSLTERQYDMLERFAIAGIQYVEQTGLKSEILLEAQDKFQIASDYVQTQLDKARITVFTAKDIEVVIESALRRGLHKQFGETLVITEGK